MKPSTLLFVTALALSPLTVVSQEPIWTEPQIVAKGPDSRVWERLSTTVLEDGSVVTNRSSYTEFQSGLHHLVNGEYVLSDDSFELFNDNAIARHAAHQVILNANVNSDNAVDLLSPTGQRLVLRPRWLCFYDPVTQQSTVVAEVRDSGGALVEKNVIVWEDCWTDFRGSIRATFRTTGYESDLLIHDRGFGQPEEYGMQSDRVRLELWHEAIGAPAAELRQRILSDGAVDQTIDFGDMHIGAGKAFSIDGAGESLDVVKTWTTLAQRTFLIESVPYAQLRPLLERLPQQARVGPPPDRARLMARVTPNREALVAKMIPKPGLPERKVMAAIKPAKLGPRPAVVVDYTIHVGNKTNVVFAGDGTYYISGPLNLYGSNGSNTVFEAGTVIKLAPTNNARVNVASAVTWEGTSYRPVVFTARDDHTQGERISGVTLSGYYGETALYIDAATSGTNVNLQNLRICYATNGLIINGGSGHTISHAQFVNCLTGIRGTNTQFSLRNALFDHVYTNFAGSMATGVCEHLTVDVASWLNFNSNLGLRVTNSLLAVVTNVGTISSNYTVSVASPTGIFTNVGAGYHYLADSTYRNLGSTNINSGLATALLGLTTYPPLLLTSDITIGTTLNPQAGRDTDIPDIGYHYDCLDYCLTDLNLTNSATLLLTNGVAVGFYGTNGLRLWTGVQLLSEGKPGSKMNRLTRYNTVQEQPYQWGPTNFASSFMVGVPGVSTTLGTVRLRFTDVTSLANSDPWRYFCWPHKIYNTEIKDCALRGICVYLSGQSNITAALTNNLSHRSYLSFNQPTGSDFTLYLRNIHFYRGILGLWRYTNANTWTVHDCFFDTVSMSGATTSANSHNGYYNTTALSGGSNNKTLTVVDYKTGPLGTFYYPTNGSLFGLTNLLNVGSRAADLSGLYHHTLSIGLAKETNSTVDIGFHYVATDASGNPLDADGDGMPDYFENFTGNALVASGQTSWTNASDLGLKVFITRPKRGQNIP